MTQRIEIDPPVKFLIIAIVLAAALMFEVARVHGQQFATELYPPSTKQLRSTINTAIPRAADAVTPTPEPAPTPPEPAFVDPVVVKPKLLFLTCRNAPSFMFSQLAARETAAIERLREKYDIIQVNVPALPSIVDVEANRLYTPDQCTLYYGCAPIAGLQAAIERNAKSDTAKGRGGEGAIKPKPTEPTPVAAESGFVPVNVEPPPTLGEASTLKPVPDPAFAN